MRSIFESQTRNDIVGRINSLSAESKARWGKMSVGQMLRHCAACEEYYFGRVPIKRSFLGRLIGPMVIKGILKDETKQLGKNAPTSATLKVTEPVRDIEEEKKKWIALINDYGAYDKDHLVHWFFGKMTKDQLGCFVYKHCDHHLRQFGA
ncbi:MAG: DUF1569 domain-containing protein [Bacteroidota bacterium]|nr:DUF1569 domain-containing protein [Bacteroidota bacterium]MDP4216683.1 DUF1569 domain-containing protein [Bacteroidota bacterium]MDP4244213.1 DUF1569 domain-containing protein [Bacteroidota bacterium]MDP4253415.1 DUF1569 domain-containing protein [Bacteroidota bacterium]MDP4258873.1 DUF1569 domain-containing protein [Bacteroidota bacterium]